MSNENVMLAVGNTMMGDDGAGPLLYQLMRDNPIKNWTALDGGSAPENVAHIIRELKPKRLVIVDATEMELPVGEIRIVDKELIAEMFFVSTHNLPLNFLIEQLETDVEQVIFIGIQPDIVSFAFPMTEKVKSAVRFLYDFLNNQEDFSKIAAL